MNVLKTFFSHVLAAILFCAVLYLSLTTAVKQLITHDTVSTAIEKTNYWEEMISVQGTPLEHKISDELLDYLEIEDIINDYATDKILYELGAVTKEPEIDINLLNERLAEGIEKYLDEKLDEYTGGLNSFLIDNGIYFLKDKVQDYVEDKTSIDLTNKKIVTEKDLDNIYDDMDRIFRKVKNSTYIQEVSDLVYHDTLPTISIVTIVVTIILLALINFNILTGILYTITPLSLVTVTYILAYSGLKSLRFEGGLPVNALTYITEEASKISQTYFIIFLIITISVIILCFVGKYISILISHKTGKTTLDTIFDDYDSEGVVKQIQEREQQEEPTSNEAQIENTKESDQLAKDK